MQTVPHIHHEDSFPDENIPPTPDLFRPFTLRGVTLRNRIMVSPMCQYSSEDGFASDWHLVHLGSRAVGGAALVMAEATAIEKRGRISPQDLGIYYDEHIPMLARITAFIKEQGAVPAIQLAHAGRKASTYRPWSGSGELAADQGRWETIAPSAERFSAQYPLPKELTRDEIAAVVQHFQDAAKRALQAGFEVLEVHGAHGYLIHEFLSPVSNHRQDEYGGPLQHRMRFLLETVDAIRAVMPDELPLFVRLSASDWTEGGLTINDTVEIAHTLKQHGVDLIDASSGGNVATAKIPLAPGYQVPFAEQIRQEADIPTAAVGLITQPQHANDIIHSQQADLVALARELLRDPYWPMHAARDLGYDMTWPSQICAGQTLTDGAGGGNRKGLPLPSGVNGLDTSYRALLDRSYRNSGGYPMCFEFNAEPPISPQSGSTARGEEIVLESADGTRFLAYAAHTGTPAKAGIIVLPDVRGLFHFYKELALRFAEAGVEAVAIDYFGRTAGLTDRDQDFDFWPHVMETRRETLDADIAAAVAYLRGLPHAPQSLFTVGFCFGGSNSFLQASNNPGLAGAIGFYGGLAGPSRNGSPTALERACASTIPVLGLFGGADPMITAEHVQKFDEELDKAHVEHDIITYPGAPHSFFDRAQAEYAKESEDAWKRILGFVAAHTKA